MGWQEAMRGEVDKGRKGAPGRKTLSIMSQGADCWSLHSKTIDNTELSRDGAQSILFL